MIWCNPPYTRNFSTIIGYKFSKLLMNASHPIIHYGKYAIEKLSYNCMPNIGNIVSLHNKRVLKTNLKTIQQSPCSRYIEKCPLAGKC